MEGEVFLIAADPQGNVIPGRGVVNIPAPEFLLLNVFLPHLPKHQVISVM
jgi:hypothetical protein